VPTALSAVIRPASASAEASADRSDERITCAALVYGYTMDLDGSTLVADASSTFRFRNACAGRTIDDLAADVPIFVVRAGRDEMPGLNEALDRFAGAALARNLPIALANHPAGVHAFDLYDDGPAARAAIRQTLAFLRAHLLP
jgi:acetyl esterase/lipase